MYFEYFENSERSKFETELVSRQRSHEPKQKEKHNTNDKYNTNSDNIKENTMASKKGRIIKHQIA